MSNLTKLLNKKMTRKQFLITLGMIIFMASGVARIIENLKDPKILGIKPKKDISNFGSGPYGI